MAEGLCISGDTTPPNAPGALLTDLSSNNIFTQTQNRGNHYSRAAFFYENHVQSSGTCISHRQGVSGTYPRSTKKSLGPLKPHRPVIIHKREPTFILPQHPSHMMPPGKQVGTQPVEVITV